MLTSDAGQLEVTELEAWLDAECGCEADHDDPQNCTVTVVAFARDCDDSLRVCQRAVNGILQDMNGLVRCAACGKFAADCWRIIPI